MAKSDINVQKRLFLAEGTNVVSNHAVFLELESFAKKGPQGSQVSGATPFFALLGLDLFVFF